jgi:hypothetical protein
MPGSIAIKDLVLNYDPEFPQEWFRSAGMAAVSKVRAAAFLSRWLPVPTHPDAQRI